MPANNHWSEERWDNLCTQLCANFGPASAAKIIETIIHTIGGERLTIPSIQDLEKRERDRRICNYHRGDYEETAARFGIHVNTARRVVLKQLMIERQKDKNKIITQESV